MPEISVIAPVYGVEQYIYQFTESVLNQTFTDFELILVDDGSPDKCPQILDEYELKDSRVRVIHQKNGGVSVARNTGLDVAQGKYIYVVDSDDWLELNALEVLHRDAVKTDADVILGDCAAHTSNSTYRCHLFSQQFFTKEKSTLQVLQQFILCQKFSPYESKDAWHGYAAPWSRLIKKSLIDEFDIMFDPYVRGLFDDGLFSLNVMEHATSLCYGMEHIYNYRINQNSITQRFKPNEIDILRLGFEKIEEFIHINNKEDILMLPYYCHVVRFLIYRLDSYFFNVNNNKTKSEINHELKFVIGSEPFRTALEKCQLKYFGRYHQKLLICMRMNSFLMIRFLRYLKYLRER